MAGSDMRKRLRELARPRASGAEASFARIARRVGSASASNVASSAAPSNS